MVILVASNNIFRRELTSYTLIEAGHEIREIFELGQLQPLLGRESPMVIVADISIAEPDVVLRAVRQYSSAPVIWIGRAARFLSLDPTFLLLDWPHQPDELLACVARLRAPSLNVALPTAPFTQRSIGQND
jgi:hypothetical protein